jgi:hypothetical protein
MTKEITLRYSACDERPIRAATIAVRSAWVAVKTACDCGKCRRFAALNVESSQ